MGDGFDAPEQVEGILKGHGFGVHEQKSGAEVLFGGGLDGHFDLHGRDGDAGDGSAESFGQVQAGGAKATTNIQNRGTGLDVGDLS